MDKNKILDDEQLNDVSGGAVYHAKGDSKRPWQVVDDQTGVSLGNYETSEKAARAAWRNGQSRKEINADQLGKLRGKA